MIIEDGNGTSTQAKVNKKSRLYTFAVTEEKSRNATSDGRSYNINSGSIELTSANESGVFYIKNNENNDLHIDTVVVICGASTGGASTDDVIVEIIRNPTAGTLISGASAVSVNANRNFGSSSTLTVDAYKGAEANTVTDGDLYILSLLQPASRVPFDIDALLPKGSSLAVTINPPASNTSMDVMVAVVCYLEDPEE